LGDHRTYPLVALAATLTTEIFMTLLSPVQFALSRYGIGIALVFALTLLPVPAVSQRVAPLGVVRPAAAFADTTSSPPRIEPENRRRYVISAAIGAVVGAAAGFYLAAGSQTSCALPAGSECKNENYFLLDSAVGAVLGALIGIVIGGTSD
jgi:hypothetical protein